MHGINILGYNVTYTKVLQWKDNWTKSNALQQGYLDAKILFFFYQSFYIKFFDEVNQRDEIPNHVAI